MTDLEFRIGRTGVLLNFIKDTSTDPSFVDYTSKNPEYELLVEILKNQHVIMKRLQYGADEEDISHG